MSDAHLNNAAQALQRILAARHPEHSWTVTVRERQPNKAHAYLRGRTLRNKAGTVSDHPDPVLDGNVVPLPRPAHDHALKKSA